MENGISQGIFVANIQQLSNGDRGKLQVDVSAGGHTQVTALASHHYYTGSDRHIPMASVSVPVPLGAVPNLVCNPSSGGPESTASFFPFLGDAPMLGAWISMFSITNGRGSTNTVTANSDGFLLVALKTLGNGPRGMIRMNIENGSSIEYPAGSSVHSYSGSDNHIIQNSFCVPVQAGTKWNLYYNTTSEGVLYNASWIPLSSNNFQSVEDVTIGDMTQAKVDGFFFGRVWAKANGGHGSMKLQTSEDNTFDKNIISEGLASQHWNPEGDIYVSVNSAMVPVKKGDFYRAIAQQNDVNISTKAYFMPAPNFFTSSNIVGKQTDVSSINDCLEPLEGAAQRSA